MPFIKAPTGDLVRVPSGLSDEEALALAKDKFPKLFADVSKAEEGLIPSIKSGLESFGTQSIAGISDALGMSEEQVRKMVEKSQARRMETSKAPDWEDVKKAATEYGLFGGQKEEERGGASQFLRMMRGQLGESLPAMGATMAGARIGAGLGTLTSPVTGPVGPLAGGALGAVLANMPMFTGSNIERQLQQQEETGVKAPIEYGAARTGAVAQASLDVASTALVLGKLGMGKIFSDSLTKLGSTAGKEAAEKALIATAERSLTGTVMRGAGKGVVTEMPTELAQQVIERAQAGLDLFDEDAKKEYEATAVGAGGLGAMFGGVGGISGRSQARAQQRELEQARAMQAELDRRAAAAKEEEDRLARLPQDQAAVLKEFEETARAWRSLQSQSDFAAERKNYSLQEQIDIRAAAVEERLRGLEARAEELGIDPDTLKASEFGAQGIDAALAAARKAQRKASKEKSPDLGEINARVAKLEQMQAAARVAPEEQQRLEEEAGYVAPVEPQELAADTLTAQQEQLAQRDLAKRQAEEQKRQQAAAAEEAKGLAGLEKIEDTRLAGMETLRAQQEQQARVQRQAQERERIAQRGIDEATARVEGMLQNPAQTLFSLSRPVQSASQKRIADAAVISANKGQITLDAAQLLGIEAKDLADFTRKGGKGLEQALGRPVIDLRDPTQAEKALPVLEARLAEVVTALDKKIYTPGTAKRYTPKEFFTEPSKTGPGGRLTPLGRSAVTLEAQRTLLQKFIDTAKAPTEAEIPVQKLQPQQAQFRAEEHAKEREAALFDFGNAIDEIRKGPATGPRKMPFARDFEAYPVEDVSELEQTAKRNIDTVVDSLFKEAGMRRVQLGLPPVPNRQKTNVERAVREQLNLLLEKAPSSAEKATAMQAAAERAGMPIKRGMTISDPVSGELAKLRKTLDAALTTLVGQPIPQRKAAPKIEMPRAEKKVVVPEVKQATAQQVEKAVSTPTAFKTLEQAANFRAKILKAVNEGLKNRESTRKILIDVDAATEGLLSSASYTNLVKVINGLQPPSLRMAANNFSDRETAQLSEKDAARVEEAEKRVDEAVRKGQEALTKYNEASKAAKELQDRYARDIEKAESFPETVAKAAADSISAYKEYVAATKAINVEVAQRNKELAELRKSLGQTKERAKPAATKEASVAETAPQEPAKKPKAAAQQKTRQGIVNKHKELVHVINTAEAIRRDARATEKEKAEANKTLPKLKAALAELEDTASEKGIDVEVMRSTRERLDENAYKKLIPEYRALVEAIEKENFKVVRTREEKRARRQRIQQLEARQLELEDQANKLGSTLLFNRDITPYEQAKSQQEAMQASRTAEISEGRKVTRGPSKTESAAERAGVSGTAPSDITTRGKQGQFGPKVKAGAPKRGASTAKDTGVFRDTEDFADRNNIQGEDRKALFDAIEGIGAARRDSDWRLATESDTGIEADKAQAVVDRVQKSLPKGIKFVYAPTLKDAPVELLAEMVVQKINRIKGAVMPDGTVVVIGEAHKTTKDLEETIAHELIGHYGADVVVGADNVTKLSDRLFSNGPQHVAEVATGLGIYRDVATAAMAVDSLKSPESKLTFVREMIARAAEPRRVAPTFAQKVASFIKDVIATVRNWFRNSGLSSLAKADTKEIQGVIREAERQLAAGRLGLYVSPDGNVVFRDDGVPADAPQAVKDLLTGVVSAGAKRGMDNVKANLLGVGGMTQFVDRLYPIQLAVQRGVKGGLLADLEASQAMYNLRNHGKATNHALQTMSEGPRELKDFTDKGKKYFMVEKRDYGDKPAPTLVNAFKELDKSGLTPEQYDRLFTLYLATLRVKNEGVGISKLSYLTDKNGKPLVTEEGLAEVEKYVASKPQVSAAFNKAADIYSDYNKGLIDFLAQSGYISKELADELKAKKNYIPFYREKNGNYELIIDNEKTPIVVGNLKDQPHLQALVGGDQKILSIFTTGAQNTTMLTDMALRNLATKDTAHTLSKLGMVETYEGADAKTGAKKTMAFRKGMGPANPNVLRFKSNGEDVYVIVKTEGTAFEDIPADLLVKGMEGVKTTFPAALELLGAPAKFLRRFILLSPMYPVRQLTKDSFSVAGTSGANFVPIAGPLKQIASALTGHNKTIETLRSQGLGSGQVLAGSTKENMDVMLRAVASGKSTLGVMLARLEAMSMLADEGVKAAGYDSFVKQGLNPLEAWLATNEIIDFNRRGLSPSVYVLNELIPFFSAAIQGLSVFGRAMTGNMPMNERLKIREKFFKRGMAMAGLTMIYAAMMQDDEAYQNASPEAKLGNVFVRLPFLAEPLRIPIPFEYGLLFKAIPEFIFSQLTNTPDADKLLTGLKNLALQSVPLTYPQVIKPIIELQTGKDLFTERDIVPKHLQMLDASEQYTDSTTELAKMLGRTVPGISPVMVDQFIKTAGSNTLLAIASLSNVLADGVAKPDTPASKTPIFGAAFQPNDAGAIISAVYEDLEEANRKLKTFEDLVSKGETARAEKYYNTNLQVLSMGDAFGEFRNEMKGLKESEDAIRQDPKMTGVEKRKHLEDLRKLKIDVAKQYRDMLREKRT